MALRWLKQFFNLFREEEDVSKEVQRRQLYLKLSRKCMEVAQRMTSRGVSTQFNHGQCEYLANKLKEAVHGAETVQFNLPSVEIMKLLWRTAEDVKIVIHGCCRKDWILAAIVLENMSERVIQLSADLEFCILLMREYQVLEAFYPTVGYESNCFTRYESLKERVARDLSTLLTNVDTLNGLSNLSEQESQLARSLSSRLAHRSSGLVQASAWEIQYSDLVPEKKLGGGSYGTVRRSKWLGEEVAEKMFQGTYCPSFKNEVEILAGLAHPNIVPLLGYAVDGNKCCIIMELMDGDLFSYMEERLRHNPTFKVPFSDFETMDMMLETAKGMLYLHEHKVVHRDLKSRNILVKSRKDNDVEFVYAKVADFGLSKTKESSSSYTDLSLNTGTTRWMAPELIPPGEDDLLARTADHDSQLRYPFKVDVYSFGMVCYEICTGQVPFSSNSNTEVKKMVLRGDRPKLPDHCSHALKHLIHSCWDAEPNRRPSFGEICNHLRKMKYFMMKGSGCEENEDRTFSLIRATELELNFGLTIGFGSNESVDLQAMVHDFIENDSLDYMDGTDSDGLAPAKKLIETLQALIAPGSALERELVKEVKLQLLSIKDDSDLVCEPEGSHCKGRCVKRFVVNHLNMTGYDAALCKCNWLPLGRVPGGEYEYIDVVFDGNQLVERLIVDVDFKAQFEIARPTPQYEAVWKILPAVFVGSTSKLEQILQFMTEAIKASMNQRGMHLPPWRTLDYTSSKWLSTYERKMVDVVYPMSLAKRPRSYHHWQENNNPFIACVSKQCGEYLRHTKVSLIAEMKSSEVVSNLTHRRSSRAVLLPRTVM